VFVNVGLVVFWSGTVTHLFLVLMRPVECTQRYLKMNLIQLIELASGGMSGTVAFRGEMKNAYSILF
jgi:hypothetical protein